jgi:hypothetical protein
MLETGAEEASLFLAVGIMVVEVLRAFHHSACAEAVELLLPVRLISGRSATATRNVKARAGP